MRVTNDGMGEPEQGLRLVRVSVRDEDIDKDEGNL